MLKAATDKPLYSLTEVCQLTGIGRTKLLEEVYSGRLGSVNVGRRRLVSRAQLAAWVAALESRSETAGSAR